MRDYSAKTYKILKSQPNSKLKVGDLVVGSSLFRPQQVYTENGNLIIVPSGVYNPITFPQGTYEIVSMDNAVNNLITVKGVGQEEGKEIKGYVFPQKIMDFKVPTTVLFAPNYNPIFYKAEDSGMLKQVQSNKRYNSVNIVRNTFKDHLITDEGYLLKYVGGGKNMLIAEKSTVTKNEIPQQKSTEIKKETTQEITPKKEEIKKTTDSSLNTEIETKILETGKKFQIGWTLVGWGIFGIIAYKFWNKSNFWKIAIAGAGIYNLYNTYKVFKSPVTSEKKESEPEVSEVPEKINLLLNDLQSNPIKDESDLTKRLNKFGVSQDEFATYIQVS